MKVKWKHQQVESHKKISLRTDIRLFKKNYDLYLMLIPVMAFYIIFKYIPMYGIQIAFRDYNPGLGFSRSVWIGLDNFKFFFSSFRFSRMVVNSIVINLLQIVFQFPIPIVFAILINEVRKRRFKTLVLNLTYIPHFLSTVIIIALINTVCNPEYGFVNEIITRFGGEPIRFMESAQWFKPIYIISGIWQNTGWDSWIYIGALAGIDQALYEAAEVDGASKFKQMFKITVPCIMQTIVVMLILKIGGIMDLGVDKVLLMQNELNISSSDVLSVYVYQVGIQEGDFSYAAAIDLFNNVINFLMLILANRLSKRISGSSLW